ncbi:hypothetical protein V8E36_001128 [Tilletia maclaganii]
MYSTRERMTSDTAASAAAPRQLLQIPYIDHHGDGNAGPDPAQTIDLFLPAALSSPTAKAPRLLIFIHGGAWRSGNSKELHPLALNLATSASSTEAGSPHAVALINYRLSPPTPQTSHTTPVFHPAHINDIHAALRYILLHRPHQFPGEYDIRDVILGGHSVGAWLVASVMLDPPSPPSPSSGTMTQIPTHEALHPPTLRSHIHTYLLLDGIYDLDALLEEYPSYSSFVSQAFERPNGEGPVERPRDRYRVANVTSWPFAQHYRSPNPPEKEGEDIPRIRIAHSRDDELLSLAQPELVRKYLTRLITERLGGRPEPIDPWIQTDYDSINGGHFDLLPAQALADYIRTLFKQS